MRNQFLASLAIMTIANATVAATTMATAETMFDCQSIRKPKERLACYDKLSPPVSADQSKTSGVGIGNKKLNALDQEDARMKKLLRPICRNC